MAGFASTGVDAIPEKGRRALGATCSIVCGAVQGCGIIVGPSRVLTHWNVFDSSFSGSEQNARRNAADAAATLQLPDSGGGVTKFQCPIRSDKFFFGTAQLQFCVVAIDIPERAREKVKWLPLSKAPVEVGRESRVAILQRVYPDVRVVHTRLITVESAHLRYPGSPEVAAGSGSPVFDADWNLLALHCDVEDHSSRLKSALRIRRVTNPLEASAVCLTHFVERCEECWFHCKYCHGWRYTPVVAHMESHIEDAHEEIAALKRKNLALQEETSRHRGHIPITLHVSVEQAKLTQPRVIDWQCRLGSTVAKLKEFIQGSTGVPPGEQSVFVANHVRPVTDETTVLEMNLGDGDSLTVLCARREPKVPIKIQIVGEDTRVEWLASLNGDTVRSVKEHLQDTGIGGDRQRVMFNGRVLDDRRKLVECGIGEGAVVLVQLIDEPKR